MSKSDSDTTGWRVGQQVIINRQIMTTIDRVTPSGRIVANGRTFNADGRERSGGSSFRRAQLEHFTADIKAEIDLISRGREASRNAVAAIENADKWLRRAFGTWDKKVPDADDVAKAEKIASAIRQIMEYRKS